MGVPVMVEAVRTPFGRRGGALAGLKGVQLLQHVQQEVLRRAGVEADLVEQVIGGCVTQIGEQSLNVTRNAWLNSDLPYQVAASTVDASCGSSQQASHLISALIAADAIEVGIACGVESMSRVPIGSNLSAVPGHYKTRQYPYDDPPQAQFGGAERIAAREGLSRTELDAYALRSQQRAAHAWQQGHFAAEVSPVSAPVLDEGGQATGPVRLIEQDEGLRASTGPALAGLQPLMPGGVHTAASSSQISDGAAAILWMSQSRAEQLGLKPRARLRHQLLVGADPYYLLDGPIEATRRALSRSGLGLGDLDRYEVNEAFSAVVLAWQRAFDADEDRLNVNGGAISLGHPLGATGTRLLATAVAELERIDGEFALVTMCCGGSLGTASILQRL
jgi:acetyl-CoA C-acetyltransferase